MQQNILNMKFFFFLDHTQQGSRTEKKRRIRWRFIIWILHFQLQHPHSHHRRFRFIELKMLKKKKRLVFRYSGMMFSIFSRSHLYSSSKKKKIYLKHSLILITRRKWCLIHRNMTKHKITNIKLSYSTRSKIECIERTNCAMSFRVMFSIHSTFFYWPVTFENYAKSLNYQLIQKR